MCLDRMCIQLDSVDWVDQCLCELWSASGFISSKGGLNQLHGCNHLLHCQPCHFHRHQLSLEKVEEEEEEEEKTSLGMPTFSPLICYLRWGYSDIKDASPYLERNKKKEIENRLNWARVCVLIASSRSNMKNSIHSSILSLIPSVIHFIGLQSLPVISC